MATQKLDFFSTPYSGNFERRIYIPKELPFTITGSTSTDTTITFTTEADHCLSTGDNVLLCVYHQNTAGKKGYVITYADGLFPITRVSATEFTITYANPDCDRTLLGEGHEPDDLTAISYTGALFGQDSSWRISGSGAEYSIGDSSILVSGEYSEALANGGTLRLGSFSTTIVGVTPASSNCGCENQISIALTDTVPTGITSENWSVDTYRSSGTFDERITTLTVTKDNTIGAIDFSFDTGLTNQSRTYQYHIYSTVGGEKATAFNGSIAYGLGDDGGCASVVCPFPSPVVVADPDTINNVPITVALRSTLNGMGAGLADNTLRTPLGINTVGDVVLPNYRLITSADAADGVTLVASSAAGKLWRMEKNNDAYNVQWWAVFPDSGDQYDRFQAAVDYIYGQGGGRLYIPSGRYELAKPVVVKDRLEIYGEGRSTILYNAGGSANNSLKGIFFFGCHHPAQNDDYTYYAVNDVTAGDDTITLTNAADAANMTVGRAIFIRTVQQFTAGGRFLPIRQITAKIKSIAGAVLTLEQAVTKTITAAQITDPFQAQTGIFGYVDSYVLCDAVVRDMAVECPQGRWHLRSGTLDCRFANIDVITSVSLIYGNAFYRTIFDNISGSFHERAFEVATGGGELLIQNCFGTFVDTGYGTVGETLWRVGEYAQEIEFRNCRIVAVNYLGGFIAFQGIAVSLVNCTGVFEGSAGSVIQFSSDINNQTTFLRNKAENCRFFVRGTATDNYVRLGGSTGTQSQNCVISACNFYGSVTTAVMGEGNTNTVTGNTFESGGVNFTSSTFFDNLIQGNTFGDVPFSSANIKQNRYEGNKVSTKDSLLKQSTALGEKRRALYTVLNTLITDEILLSISPNDGKISTEDELALDITGSVTSAVGGHTIALKDTQGTVASIVFADGETGAWSIRANLEFMSTSGNLATWSYTTMKAGVQTEGVRRRTGLGAGEAGTSSIVIDANNTVAGDSLIVLRGWAKFYGVGMNLVS